MTLPPNTADSGASNAAPSIVIDEAPLGLTDVWQIAHGKRTVTISSATSFIERLNAARDFLDRRLEASGAVYGVTTGFGDSCETDVGGSLTLELPRNLFRFHGCGVGEPFDIATTRAILVARLASLKTGYSGIRSDVLEALALFLNADIVPYMPSQGSVGASGDLTPLSYLAATLSGEREVYFKGTLISASEAWKHLERAPLVLRPKESLAIMNGTSAMTGLACLVTTRAQKLTRWASALTALASDALRGEPRHFDERLALAKPHPGQIQVSAWIRDDLAFDKRDLTPPQRIQDRYSIRCAPHVLGVLVDVLTETVRILEIELNSANDNPLVDPLTGDVLHGGNFYGGHVCAQMDALKTQLANLGDLLDRQLVLLCHPNTNQGLPANLVNVGQDERPCHHGFKAMQITTSALAAELGQLSMPASVFSRSTENHNQDKVSMGTIAARNAARAVDMAETLAAIHTLALCQAVDLRATHGIFGRGLEIHARVRSRVPSNTFDRRMDDDIAQVLELYRSSQLGLPDDGLPPLCIPTGRLT